MRQLEAAQSVLLNIHQHVIEPMVDSVTDAMAGLAKVAAANDDDLAAWIRSDLHLGSSSATT